MTMSKAATVLKTAADLVEAAWDSNPHRVKSDPVKVDVGVAILRAAGIPFQDGEAGLDYIKPLAEWFDSAPEAVRTEVLTASAEATFSFRRSGLGIEDITHSVRWNQRRWLNDGVSRGLVCARVLVPMNDHAFADAGEAAAFLRRLADRA